MENLTTKVIETDRLILRPFKIEDAKYMYKNWASHEEVTKYLKWKPHKNIEESKEYIKFLIEGYKKGDCYDWAIELKEINQPIGSIGIVQLKEDVKLAHIGYCIGNMWWNKGITSEAFSRVIKYLFEEVGVNRIESTHAIDNPNSGKVMKKCGLKYEGTLRQSDITNEGICDMAWYGLLKSEYYNK